MLPGLHASEPQVFGRNPWGFVLAGYGSVDFAMPYEVVGHAAQVMSAVRFAIGKRRGFD